MGVVVISTEQRHRKLSAQITIDGEGKRRLLINDEPLMGVAEVAEALGVRVQNVGAVKDLPEPVEGLRSTRLWLGYEVKELVDRRGRVKSVA